MGDGSRKLGVSRRVRANQPAATKADAFARSPTPKESKGINDDTMFRKSLIPLLLDRPMSLSQIARETGEAPKDVTQALRHLARSLRHTEQELVIDPAECRRCGFEFRSDKFTRPSKCPQCRGTWIAEPLFSVTAKKK